MSSHTAAYNPFQPREEALDSPGGGLQAHLSSLLLGQDEPEQDDHAVLNLLPVIEPEPFGLPSDPFEANLGQAESVVQGSGLKHYVFDGASGNSSMAGEQRQFASNDGMHPLHKTMLCNQWQSGTCFKGACCSFAHGEKDLRKAPDTFRSLGGDASTPPSHFKTELCKHWQQGTCQHGAQCWFAHGESQLRLLKAPEAPEAKRSLHLGDFLPSGMVPEEDSAARKTESDNLEMMPADGLKTESFPRLAELPPHPDNGAPLSNYSLAPSAPAYPTPATPSLPVSGPPNGYQPAAAPSNPAEAEAHWPTLPTPAPAPVPALALKKLSAKGKAPAACASGSSSVRRAEQSLTEVMLAKDPLNAKHKTMMCNMWLAGGCTRGKSCTFAHGEKQLRKAESSAVKPTTYKTQLCRHWQQGTCQHGNRCLFAHGESELKGAAGSVAGRGYSQSAVLQSELEVSVRQRSVPLGAFLPVEMIGEEAQQPQEATQVNILEMLTAGAEKGRRELQAPGPRLAELPPHPHIDALSIEDVPDWMLSFMTEDSAPEDPNFPTSDYQPAAAPSNPAATEARWPTLPEPAPAPAPVPRLALKKLSAKGKAPAACASGSSSARRAEQSLTEAMLAKDPLNAKHKTMMCNMWLAGGCTRGKSCTFAHGEKQLRKAESSAVKPTTYKTQLCRHWQQGTCQHGGRCLFAHGESELKGAAGSVAGSSHSILQSELEVSARQRSVTLGAFLPVEMIGEEAQKPREATQVNILEMLTAGAEKGRQELPAPFSRPPPVAPQLPVAGPNMPHAAPSAAYQPQQFGGDGGLLDVLQPVASMPPVSLTQEPGGLSAGLSQGSQHGISAAGTRSLMPPDAHFPAAPNPPEPGSANVWKGKAPLTSYAPNALAIGSSSFSSSQAVEHQAPPDVLNGNYAVSFHHKTVLCRTWQQGWGCPNGALCPFAHGEQEQRKAPAARAEPKDFKTQLCKYWEQGKCKAGSRCTFAHSGTDLQQAHPRQLAGDPPEQPLLDLLQRAAQRPVPPPAIVPNTATAYQGPVVGAVALNRPARPAPPGVQPVPLLAPLMQHAVDRSSELASARPPVRVSGGLPPTRTSTTYPLELLNPQDTEDGLLNIGNACAHATMLLSAKKYLEALALLEAFDWEAAEAILTGTEYHQNGRVRQTLNDAMALIKCINEEKHKEMNSTREEKERLEKRRQQQYSQAMRMLESAVLSGDDGAARSAVTIMNRAVDKATLPFLVWTAAAVQPNTSILKALSESWDGMRIGFCWTVLRVPENVLSQEDEKYILHEAINKEATGVAGMIVQRRRESLLERCPGKATGNTALMLALRIMSSPSMVDILSPQDFPAAWQTACVVPPRGPLSPLKFAELMSAAASKNSQQELEYFQAMFRQLQSKQQASNARGGSRQLTELAPQPPAPRPVPRQSEQEMEMRLRRARLVEHFLALNRAVKSSNLAECQVALNGLSGWPQPEVAEVMDNSHRRKLMWTSIELDNLGMLQMLSAFFQLPWHSAHFEGAGASKLALAHALRRRAFKVGEAALSQLASEPKEEAKRTLRAIRAELDSPMTVALEGRSPAPLIEKLMRCYLEIEERGLDDRTKRGLSPLGAALKSETPEYLRIILPYCDILSRFKVEGLGSVSVLWYAVSRGSPPHSDLWLIMKVSLLLDEANRRASNSGSRFMERFLEDKTRSTTALHLAVSKQLLEAAARLILVGASCTAQGPDGNSVLHLLVLHTPTDHPSDLLKSATESLPPASRGELLDNTRNKNGDTVLHLAVEKHMPAIAQYLVDRGASLTVANQASRTVLALVLEAHSAGVQGMEQLLVTMKSSWSPTQLHRVLFTTVPVDDRTQVVAWLTANAHALLHPVTEDKRRLAKAAQEAVHNGNAAVLELFMEMPKFSAKNLHLHPLLLQADVPPSLGLISELLAAGADVDAREQGTVRTMLHYSAEQGDLATVEVLVQAGANVSRRDSLGNTPLHLAVMYVENLEQRHQLCRELIKSDMTVMRIRNDDNQTPSQCTKSKKTKQFLQSQERILKGKEQAAAYNSAVHGLGGPSAPGRRESNTEKQVALKRQEAKKAQAEAEAAGLLFPADETADQRRHRVILAIEAIQAQTKLLPRQGGAKTLAPKDAKIRGPEAAELSGLAGALLQPQEGAAGQDVHSGHSQNVGRYEGLLEEIVSNSTWEVVTTRDARQEWSQMDDIPRYQALQALATIITGQWYDNPTILQVGKEDDVLQHLDIWSSGFSSTGQVVFQVSLDYSERAKSWQEVLRLWAVTLSPKRYEEQLPTIKASHQRSKDVNKKLRLAAQGQTRVVVGEDGIKQRLPLLFSEYNAEASMEAMAKPEVREFLPPASAEKDTYTLLKFYTVSKSLLETVAQGLDDGEVDFPFRVSPAELAIIEMVPQPPCSMLLLGRSGTGKTTCAVYRMWSKWMGHRLQGKQEPFHQVFLTASATLKEQVSRAFRKLQTAGLADAADELQAHLEASQEEYASMMDVPDEAFPLFITTKSFLRMVDQTVSEPFFSARDLLGDADALDPDGMSMEIDLEAKLDLDDVFDNFDDDESTVVGGDQQPQGSGPTRLEMTYQFFVSDAWVKITNKEQRDVLKPALVYQEIMSYIKGSSEALRSADGHLSIEGYLSVGKKRAPNFSDEERQVLYPVFQNYQRFKANHNRFDNLDLISHVYQAIDKEGYRGTPIHSLYRDEVQDFTQAELLLDLRCVADPNSLFYCGDTCQTIARGIGFRFTDIQTLIYEEAKERKEEAQIVVPLINHLKINYRTHSGIIDVASSIVDLLKRFFPRHIDSLEREQAFFKGPYPLLLSSLSIDDMSILLSGSDRSTSQVEFGAHQVILVRNTSSITLLPEALQQSSAIIMTVSQSKGLEFDDVFLVDFFHDSPADAEWRLLPTYLEEVAEQGGKLPWGAELQEVPPDSTVPQGALRHLEFNPSRHVLLSEELKHLYTAVTRAKNNVVIFDQNPQRRSPFYDYLRRCGLARHVQESLLKDGMDASTYGLSKAASSADEWRKRAANLYDNQLFELASKSYNTAGDKVRSLMCKAKAAFQHASSMSSDTAAAKSGRLRNQFFQAGCDFITAAQQAHKAPIPVDEVERQMWMKSAARSFAKGGEPQLAGQIIMRMGLPEQAFKLLVRAGALKEAAEAALIGADSLQANRDLAQARKLRADAFRVLTKAKDHAGSLGLLEKHPEIRGNVPKTVVDKGLELGLMTLLQSGQRDLALQKSVLMLNPVDREKWLKQFGYWSELAKVMVDPIEAAELLARQDNYKEAAERLQGSFVFGAQSQTRDRLHGYYLQVGTVEAANAAVSLWNNKDCQRCGVALLCLADLLVEQQAQRPEAAVPAGEQGPRDVALEAINQLEASNDAIGRFWGTIALAKCDMLRPAEELEMYPQVPGCTVILEKMQAEAQRLQNVFRALSGRSNRKDKQQALEALETHYDLQGLSSHRSSGKQVFYRRDNVFMKRAVQFLAEISGPAKDFGPEEDRRNEEDNDLMGDDIPSEPPKMRIEVPAATAKNAIALDLLFSATHVLTQLARFNVAMAEDRSALDCLLQLPIHGSSLTELQDRRLNAILQAFSAARAAVSLANMAHEILQGPRTVALKQALARLSHQAMSARDATLRCLLTTGFFSGVLMDTDGDRMATICKYMERTFQIQQSASKPQLARAGLDLCAAGELSMQVLDPNIAMSVWRISRQAFMRQKLKSLGNMIGNQQTQNRPQVSATLQLWPLTLGVFKATNAELLMVASDQLRLNVCPDRGVEKILYFLWRCLAREMEHTGEAVLEPSAYLELLEVCSTLVMFGLQGSDATGIPLLLPLAYCDSLVGCGLLDSPRSSQVAHPWRCLEGDQLIKLLHNTISLLLHPALSPMTTSRANATAHSGYLKLRGVLLMATLANNIITAQLYGGTRLHPLGLQQCLLMIQQRLRGVVVEVTEPAATWANQLLQSQRSGDVAGQLGSIVDAMGSTTLEVWPWATLDFQSWLTIGSSAKGKGKAKQSRSAREKSMAMLSHVAGLHATWDTFDKTAWTAASPEAMASVGLQEYSMSEAAVGLDDTHEGDLAYRKAEAAAVILDCYRRWSRARRMKRLVQHLRVWVPSVRENIAKRKPRAISTIEARSREAFEAELESQRQTRTSHEGRYDWLCEVLQRQESVEALDASLCPVCSQGSDLLDGIEALSQGPGPLADQGGSHAESLEHVTARKAFETYLRLYKGRICSQLSESADVGHNLDKLQATARNRKDVELESNCLRAGGALKESREALEETLSSMESSRAWGLLEPLQRNLTSLTQKIAAVQTVLASPEASAEAQSTGGYESVASTSAGPSGEARLEAEYLDPELDLELFGEEEEEDWIDVTSKKARGGVSRGKQNKARGGRRQGQRAGS